MTLELTKKVIGNSAEFNNMLNATKLIAATDASALILGESGTGKELVAETIHAYSPRKNKPFVSINCSALPENIIESELFGHRKGSFTGADAHREGRIKAANGGTLFLDEIGELPLTAQAKLLRFLESGECQSLGEEYPTIVDVRVIAATNRNLLELVEAGQFRQDLYYRLNVIPINVPSLRERGNDVNLLLEFYGQYFADKYSISPVRFSKSANAVLKNYKWPGNVRELKNFAERMSILFAGQQIEETNLPFEMRQVKTVSFGSLFNLPETGINLENLEVNFIQQALEKTQGNRSRAARLLGLSRDTLLYRMKKYAIQ